MMRHTGGFALGATSTRSSSSSRAMTSASGEHRPERPGGGEGGGSGGGAGEGAGSPGQPEPADAEERLAELRAELAATPVVDIVANHAVGLWQLAVLHLTPDPRPDGTPVPPRLDAAALAIDALGALVEGLGARLAPHDEVLREALTQLRLAFVQAAGPPPSAE